MTFGGLGPSGTFSTVNIGGGIGSIDYEEARGDASGLVDNLIVIALRGRPLSSDVPVSGDVLGWNGQSWTPTDISILITGVAPHKLLSTVHTDTSPSDPIDGSLIAGSGVPASWVQFPIGLPHQHLRVSDSGKLNWAYDPLLIVQSGSIVNVDSNTHRIVINKTTGSQTTVNLPSSTYFGHEILIKDGKGDANQNRIYVIPPSGQTIDSLDTVIIKQRYQSMHFMFNGTEWNII